MGKKKRTRDGLVYSTDPDFSYRHEEKEEPETLPPVQQTLYISIDKKQRAGKTVTLVSGFTGTESDLKDLGKILKNLCGTGGTVKEGEILLQGNFREKVFSYLQSKEYRVKKKGG